MSKASRKANFDPQRKSGQVLDERPLLAVQRTNNVRIRVELSSLAPDQGESRSRMVFALLARSLRLPQSERRLGRGQALDASP